MHAVDARKGTILANYFSDALLLRALASHSCNLRLDVLVFDRLRISIGMGRARTLRSAAR